MGLETLGNMLNLVMLVFLMILITWFYLRYSGEHRNLSVAIDQLADLLWEHVSIEYKQSTLFQQSRLGQCCYIEDFA